MIQVDLIIFFQMGWFNHQLVLDVKYFPENEWFKMYSLHN